MTQHTPPAALDDTERQFLAFALKLAADQIASRPDEFDSDDEAALAKLRRIAEREQPAPAPRNALNAPHAAEPPAAGREEQPGGENGPQVGVQSRDAGAPHPADEERRQRYAAAITAGGSCVDLAAATRAVLTVADAEQADLRAQLAYATAELTRSENARDHLRDRVEGERRRGDHAKQRAEQAEARIRLARHALIRDGYFTADEISDDIAPRITEWLTHHRDRAEQAEAALAIDAQVMEKADRECDEHIAAGRAFRQLAERTQAWGEQHRDRANRYRARVDRARRRLDAWEQQLPETVRTATVIEVLRGDLAPQAGDDTTGATP